MYEILSLFSVFNPHLSTTQIRQFSRIVIGLLSMTGRVSMLNLSRWTPEGGVIGRSNVSSTRWGLHGGRFAGSFFIRICLTETVSYRCGR